MGVAWCRTLSLLLPLLAGAPAIAAAAGPVPPCAGAPRPAWPAPGAPPAVKVWHPEDLRGWRVPACSGLAVPTGAVLVAISGSFREPGGLGAVLARMGAVSRQRAVLAWDAGRQAWRPMLEDATALTGPDAGARRADFAPAEFRPGARLHFLYDDAEPVGPMVYETLVRAADAGGLALVSRNLDPARLMGFTVADPGDITSQVTVHREAGPGDLMRYYALAAVKLSPMAAAMTPDDAHINRAVATFRYVAGIPTDTEPPAASG